jgi:hypothetical protein
MKRALLAMALVAACSKGGARHDAAAAARDGDAASAPSDPFRAIVVPDVGDAPVEPLDETGPEILVTAEGIGIDGERIDPASVKTLRPGTLRIRVDRDAPNHALVAALMWPATQGHNVVFVVNDGRFAVPVARAGMPTAGEAGPDVVQMMVVLTQDELRVLSLSGLEGSLQEPARKVPLADEAAAIAALGETLDEIVTRRWPDERPSADTQIVVLADPRSPAGLVVRVAAAARRWFPKVKLASGME